MNPQAKDQKLLSEMYSLVEGNIDDYIDREKEAGRAPISFHTPNGPDSEPCITHHTLFNTHVALRNTPHSKIHHPDHTVPYEEYMSNPGKYDSYDEFIASKHAEEDSNEQQKPVKMLSWKDGTVIGVDYSNKPIGYTYIGMPNSASFDKSILSKANDWKVVYTNRNGTYDIKASPSLKVYYDVDSSD